MSKIVSAEESDRAFAAINSPEGLTAFADRLKPSQKVLRVIATLLTKNHGEDVAAVFMHVIAFVWCALDENVTQTLTPEAFSAAAEKIDRLIVAHKLVQPVDYATLQDTANSVIVDQPHLAPRVAAIIWLHVEESHVDVKVMGRILRDVAAVANALEFNESLFDESLSRPLRRRQRVPLTYEAANRNREAFAKNPTDFQAFTTELLEQRPELEAYLEHVVSSWRTDTRRATGILLTVATVWHYFDTGLILAITADELQTGLDALNRERDRFEHPTAAQILPEEPELARAINDWMCNEVDVGLIPAEFVASALLAVLTVVKVLYDKTVGMVLYYEAGNVHEDFLDDTAKRDVLVRKLLAQKPGLAAHMQLLKTHTPEVVCGAVILMLPTIWQCLDPELTCDLTTSELNFASQKIREWTDPVAISAARTLVTQPQLGLALSDQIERAVEAGILKVDEAEIALKTMLLIACALDFKVKGVDERDTVHFVPHFVPRSTRSTHSKFTEAQIAAALSKKSPAAQPSTLMGYIREPDGAACCVDLDLQQLQQQLKEIISGPFDAIVRENATPGAHFVQLVGRSELAPSVWLRTRLNVRGASTGSRKVLVNGKRTTVSLTRFVPAAVSTLLADDAALIETKFYAVQPVAPSVQTGAVDAVTHEAIVANYLGICEQLNSLIEATGVEARSRDGNDNTVQVMRQDAERIWPSLRDAVIFELSADAYVQLYEEFAYYIARSAKVSIHPSESIEKILDQLTPGAEKRVTEMIRSGAAAPFPEKLPFKSCFFAYGAGVNETERLAVPAFVVGADTGTILGHLVCESGEVVRFARRAVGNETALQFESERLPGQFSWTQPHNLAPWIVNALVDYVNEHKTLIEMGKIGAVYRATVKKITARLKLQPVPPPSFYVVYMKDNYVRETSARQAALIKRHIDWQHRWKVRGHDCIRFQRGPLPIDLDLLDRFTKRGYKVFTNSAPDVETFADLHKRGVSEKGPDEWLAILKYWREPYEKGPEDKPLIESVRRSTKKFETLPDDVN